MTKPVTDHLEALAPLLSRRSVPALEGPAPSDAQIDAILRASVTVPDHGNLRPWRLVVVEGDARAAFGDALAAAALEQRPDLPEAILDRVRAKAFAAPTLVAVVARVDPSTNVPEWEQVASAACVGYAITLAAHHIGLGAIWKSTPFVVGARLRAVLDMGPDDQFLGWINLGRRAPGVAERRRDPVDLASVARRLRPDGAPVPYRVGERAIDQSSARRP